MKESEKFSNANVFTEEEIKTALSEAYNTIVAEVYSRYPSEDDHIRKHDDMLVFAYKKAFLDALSKGRIDTWKN